MAENKTWPNLGGRGKEGCDMTVLYKIFLFIYTHTYTIYVIVAHSCIYENIHELVYRCELWIFGGRMHLRI